MVRSSRSACRVVAVAERDAARARGRVHARNRAQRLEQAAVKRSALRWPDTSPAADRSGTSAADRAGIPGRRAAGARGFASRRPAPISSTVASASSAAARPFRSAGRVPLDVRVDLREHLVQVGLCGVPRGRNPEEQPGHDRQRQSKQQHVDVHASPAVGNRFAGISALIASTPHTAAITPTTPPIVENTRLSISNCCSSRSAARPDRRPHRDLFLPRRRARQQQVRRVGRRDEQHTANRGKQHDQRGPQLRAHEHMVEVDEPDAPLPHVGILPAHAARRRHPFPPAPV